MSQQEEKVSLIPQMSQSPARPSSYGMGSPITDGQDAVVGNWGTLWSPKCRRGVGREQGTGQEIPKGNGTGL